VSFKFFSHRLPAPTALNGKVLDKNKTKNQKKINVMEAPDSQQ